MPKWRNPVTGRYEHDFNDVAYWRKRGEQATVINHFLIALLEAIIKKYEANKDNSPVET